MYAADLMVFAEMAQNVEMQAVFAEFVRRIKSDKLEFRASSAKSEDIMAALSRLHFTVHKRLELPCCLTGYTPFTGQVAAYRCDVQGCCWLAWPSAILLLNVVQKASNRATLLLYRWEFGEATKAEVAKSTEWLRKYVCPPGVTVISVASVTWLRAEFPADSVTIKSSKTDFLFLRSEVAEPLLVTLDPDREPSVGQLLQLLPALLAAMLEGDKHHEARHLYNTSSCTAMFSSSGLAGLCSLRL